jgi:hypothetical protein
MESHDELIKPMFCQLITWTPLEEEITLLELFGGIGIGFEALLQSRMVVRKYFYVDIDPIARQVAALRMMELTTKFFHNSLQPLHGRPVSFSCPLTYN